MKATRKDVEIAFKRLCEVMGKGSGYEKGQWFLAYWGRRVRIEEMLEKGARNTPLGKNYYTNTEFYHILWFAISAIGKAQK